MFGSAIQFQQLSLDGFETVVRRPVSSAATLCHSLISNRIETCHICAHTDTACLAAKARAEHAIDIFPELYVVEQNIILM